MHTNPSSFLYTGTGAKSIPLNSLPPEAWTPIGGELTNTQAQTYASTVAYLHRAIAVRANALTAVPWKIAPVGDDAPAIWTSEDEDPPDNLKWAGDMPMLLWRTVVSWCFYNQAYWLLEHNRVRVLDLKWLDPDSMTPKWSAKQGLVGFERRLGTEKIPLTPADVVYLWRQGLRETEPASPPAQAAMQASGVLYNADKFSAEFFERGAIKATLLTIDGNPSDADLKKLEAWWKRFFSGVKSAWTTAAVRADVKAVPVGEGLESLTNSTLTAEKREDIATALGVPHSLIMASAANYATAQQDERNFYNLTVVPDCLLIQRQLNRQLFAPLGLRFTFDPQEMTVYQEDETKRSGAFAAYLGARDAQGRGLPLSAVAEMLGLYLPEGMDYDDLDDLEPEAKSEPVTALTAQQDSQDSPDAPGQRNEQQRDEEVKRLQRWLKKRPHRNTDDFASAILKDWEKRIIAEHFRAETPIVMTDAQMDSFVAGVKAEAQPGDTGAPFRAESWESYP